MAAREDWTLTLPPPDPKTITILMGLYNGATYLDAQLRSIAAQTHSAWRLVVGDDGSTDAGPAILNAFAARYPARQITLQDGPQRGFATNYLNLLASLPDQPGWIAFADQDDVWLPEKLSNGLETLQAEIAPAICAGPVWRVAQDLSGQRQSGGWSGPTGFANALVQNIVQGNTVLANPAAAQLLVRAARATVAAGHMPVAHDWWTYQIITGAGGRVVQDTRPSLLYRQHAGNMIGARSGAGSGLARLRRGLCGTHRRWSAANIAALSPCAPLLSSEGQSMLAAFTKLHTTRSLPARWNLLRRLKLRRQGHAGGVILTLAALLGRV
ncbi:MAG: glycosyltransferase [Paracoccaceae bacterium]